MTHLKMHSMNKIDENISKIAQLFPNCVTEAKDANGDIVHKIDFDMLKQELSDTLVEGREERYQFTWPDKRKAILAANAPINKTLRPCREESVDFDHTQNLYIEGDNLEVLKLLQETYLGKIKMIYIDPPYNTGNDFVYEDDFAQDAADYITNSGQTDEDGNRLVANTESNGRFHTDWLNMMYPRLKLARDLLSDDGVIFISIDDNEVENLKKICDEVFGAINVVGTFIVKSNPRGSMSESEIANLHEYILLIAKNRINANIIGHEISDEMAAEYKYVDDSGKYRLLGLRMRGGFWRRTDRPKLYFPIYVNPTNFEVSLEKTEDFREEVFPIQPTTMEEGTWRWSKEKILQDRKLLIAKTVKRGEETVWDIYQKDYFDRGGTRRTKAKSIWDDSEINYQNGTVEVKNLFQKGGIFDYSKPVHLIEKTMRMLQFENSDIILDFFSGSATTAHAVMQLNSEDGGKRKFIMVQLPKVTDEKSEAYKAGYKNICDIGKERIRRAGKTFFDIRTRCDLCISNIVKILKNEYIKSELESFVRESIDIYNEDDNDERVQYDYLHSKIINIINEETKLYDNEKLFDKYENELSIPIHDLSELLSGVIKGIDIGFRVLKLDESNMEDVYYSPDHFDKNDLFKSNIKSDRTPEDLLFQVMLDLGIMLSGRIETKKIDGKTVFYVEGNYLVACFDENVDEKTITAIAKEKPYYFVMRDASYANDSVATNFEQIFVTYSPETVRKVL